MLGIVQGACLSGMDAGMLSVVERLGGHVVLLLICLLIVVSCGPGKEHRYYELTLDISVDGERVQFTRYFDCVRVPPDWLFPSPAGVGWSMPKGSLVAKRLSSGAGIVWWSFFPCRRESFEPWQIGKPPKTLVWFDNAEKPQRVEEYAREVYFKHPEARVIWHGGTGRRVAKADPSDPEAEVPWLRTGKPPMIAFFAHILEKEIWSRDPILGEKLAKMTEPQGVMVGKIGTPGKTYFHFYEGYMSPMTISPETKTVDLDPRVKKYDGVVIYFQNLNQRDQRNPQLLGYEGYVFMIDRKLVSDNFSESIYYPETQHLIQFHRLYLSAHVMKRGLR